MIKRNLQLLREKWTAPNTDRPIIERQAKALKIAQEKHEKNDILHNHPEVRI
jgi:hypothetical protein